MGAFMAEDVGVTCIIFVDLGVCAFVVNVCISQITALSL